MSVRDASTVMILREVGQEFEVFMVKRHSKMAFMANAYVYPGGKLDPEDSEPGVHECVECEDDAFLTTLAPHRSEAIGLCLAGVREVFEESGFLLARREADAPGAFVDLMTTPQVEERFKTYRRELQRYETSLAAVARAESLVISLNELAYFARWVTPTFEPKRYDTRFFVARAPQKQRPIHDGIETTESRWLTPGRAIDRARAGEIFVAPPTLRTLEQIASFESLDAIFEFTASRTPPVILPHLDTSGPHAMLVLPGDPEFPHDAPEYQGLDPVDDGITRLVRKDGVWHSEPS